MGYESRIYFCKDYPFPEPIHHTEVIAMIDMGKMGYGDTALEFRKCFDTPTPFSIRTEGYNDELDVECMVDVTEDCYGDRLCYASDKQKLYKLAKKLSAESDYWRLERLEKLIEAFKDDDIVYIVHYGY